MRCSRTKVQQGVCLLKTPRVLLLVLLNPLWVTTAHAALSAACLIEPTQQVNLGTPVTGVLEKVWVKRGDAVKKGQVLATLHASVEQAALALAKYKSEQQAALALAEHKMQFAKQKYQRRQAMAQDQLMPEQERDDAEADYRLAEAEWQLAQENHQLAIYEYQQQKAQLAQRTLRSPLTGVVVEQNAYAGETVEANSNTKPLLKLAQLDPLRVQVILAQRYFNQVRVGQRVTVVPEKPLTETYQATVKTVDKVLDAASGTFVVFLDLGNKALRIPAGIRCQANFSE